MPTVALALLLCLLAAVPAQAATVRVGVREVDEPDEEFSREDTVTVFATLRFTAAAREVNRVTVRPVPGSRRRLRVTDRRARLRARGRCEQRGSHSAVCRLPPADVTSLRLRLRDRRDRFTASRRFARPVVVDGGDGADVLRGGPRADVLRGGAGADRVSGRDGRDLLSGGRGGDRLGGGRHGDRLLDGPGRDRLRGGPDDDGLRSGDGAGRRRDDVLDGGDGADLVSFETRRAPVEATLGATGGEPGEADRLRRAERLRGGRGDDVLRGDGERNILSGGGGFDRYDAGAGNDLVRAGEGSPEPAADVTCGEGGDAVVTGFRGRQLLRPDCERVRSYLAYQPEAAAQPLEVTADRVVVDQPCAASAQSSPPAPVRLVVPAEDLPWRAPGAAGTVLAQGTPPAGETAPACRTTLALTADGRALLATGAPTPVTLSGAVSWSFVLGG